MKRIQIINNDYHNDSDYSELLTKAKNSYAEEKTKFIGKIIGILVAMVSISVVLSNIV